MKGRLPEVIGDNLAQGAALNVEEIANESVS
jgi:hypothetical protein